MRAVVTEMSYMQHRMVWDKWVVDNDIHLVDAVVYRPGCDWVWVRQLAEHAVIGGAVYPLKRVWHRVAVSPPVGVQG